MTDRSAPDDALVLALLDAATEGTLDAHPLRAEMQVRLSTDPALRAEVDGLLAMRTLLDKDAQWGRDSGVDVPPPHLLSAILNAEVAARPDEIRQAVALARSAPEAAKNKPLWARLQSWWMGGGVALGAAAAVLFVISRTDLEPVAPTAAAPATTTADAAPRAEAPPPEPVAPDGDRGGASLADKKTDGKDNEDGKSRAEKRDANSNQKLADPDAADAYAGEGDRKGGLDLDAPKAVERAELKLEEKPAEKAAATTTKTPAPPPPPKTEAPAKKAPARPADEAFAFDDGTVANSASNGGPAPTTPPLATMAPSTTPPAPAPSTSVGSASGYTTAQESTQGFSKLRKAKEAKKIQREKESLGLGAAAPSAPSAQRSNAPAADTLTPTEAREDMERKKRLDDASMMLTSAERELSGGRAANALELAVRAEAAAGTALGFVPASTQVRAYVALKRPQDAAKVATRLLQADSGDPVLVDGMIAGAGAAEAIGDRRLAERLLLKALAPQNKDAPRRAKAQEQLNTLRARELRDRAQYEAPAAAAAPAKDAAADSAPGY